MTDLIRGGLRTASIVTSGDGRLARLAWSSASCRAAIPGHVPLWIVGCGRIGCAFVALSLVATRPGRSLDLGTGIVLHACSALAAVAFGLLVLAVRA